MKLRRCWIPTLILQVTMATFGVGALEGSPIGQRRESPGNQKAWEDAQPPRITPESFRASVRARAVATLPPQTRRTEPAYGKTEALEDLWALATEIQALYDLALVMTPDSDVQEETENHAANSIRIIHKLLDFVSADADVPPGLPILTLDGSYPERAARLMDMFRPLIDPTVKLIAVDVLDLAVLNQVQHGFGMMEALILSLPESTPAAPGQ